MNALKLNEFGKKIIHKLPHAGNFSWESTFADFGFFRFRRKKSEFGFQTLLVGVTFRGFHVQYLKVTKMKAMWSFATKVQQCKKEIFVGGSLFSQDLII